MFKEGFDGIEIGTKEWQDDEGRTLHVDALDGVYTDTIAPPPPPEEPEEPEGPSTEEGGETKGEDEGP